MLQFIETEKLMDLQQLLLHVWENEIRNTTFKSECGTVFVAIGGEGEVSLPQSVIRQDMFVVKKKEKVTHDTVFDTLVVLDRSGSTELLKHTCINNFIDNSIVKVYANVDNELNLIYNHDTTYIIDFTKSIVPMEVEYSNECDTKNELLYKYRDLLFDSLIATRYFDFRICDNIDDQLKFLGWEIIEQKF